MVYSVHCKDRLIYLERRFQYFIYPSVYFYLAICLFLSIFIFLFLYIHLSISISQSVYFYLSSSVYFYLSIFLFLSIHLSICIYLSICLFYVSICLFYVSICLFTYIIICFQASIDGQEQQWGRGGGVGTGQEGCVAPPAAEGPASASPLLAATLMVQGDPSR